VGVAPTQYKGVN